MLLKKKRGMRSSCRTTYKGNAQRKETSKNVRLTLVPLLGLDGNEGKAEATRHHELLFGTLMDIGKVAGICLEREESKMSKGVKMTGLGHPLYR